MGYKYVKNSRKNTKNRILYVMGGKCNICGYEKCSSALELHHINPEEKNFTFADNTNLGWEKIKVELPKCILVCANCHREIHQGMTEQELTSSYNEEKAKEVSQEIQDLKTHKLNYCKTCGAVIATSDANYCVKCGNLSRRVVERPSREELKKLIRITPFTTLGTQFGVSDNSIRKWCKSENLPSTKKDINTYSNEEWDLL